MSEDRQSKVSNGHTDHRRDSRDRDTRDRDTRDRDTRDTRDRDTRSYKKPEPEYTDERRPVDLGREAKPYPTGVSSHPPSSYRSSR